MVTPASSRTRIVAVAAGIVVAILAAYGNSLNVPFVFDDPAAIAENPTIRRLWPLRDVLLPPRGEGLTVEGRPVLNLTLAFNFAVGGTAVRGYHVFNVMVHALAALTLFGLVRRTLHLPRLAANFGAAALPLAAVSALLWALHPLQTESVTYIIQRAESLVGLCYLLTLYCFLRSAQGGVMRSTLAWGGAAVLACGTGMATKEVMVSAPLMVLLFDRVFIAQSWAETWRQRGRWHAALFATWLLLAFLVARTGSRGGTAGFGINVTPWQYALTQFEAVTRYVWLSIWPHPLVFDYGVRWVERAADVLPYAVILLTLLGATIVAWRRTPMVAWLGTLVFAVLSPTSSIVPGNRQTLAEHRMYLPLAAVVVLAACTVYLGARRRSLVVAGVAVAAALGVLTTRRNFDYRSELALYQDTAHKRPDNGFVRYNLGKALAEAGRHAEAVHEYEAALRLMGRVPGFHYNLANSLAALARWAEAVTHYEAALQAEPGYARAHFNLGNVLLELGRKEDARARFFAALSADPAMNEARANLGGVLLELGQLAAARTELEQVLQTEPRHALALFNLGNVALLEQRWAEAMRHFEAVLAARPDLTAARDRLELARAKAH